MAVVLAQLCQSPFVALVALVAVGAVLFAAGVRFLYGGEANEVIRFMEPEPVQEPEPEASTSATDRDRELEVLQAIVGVSGAHYFGVEGHKSKQFGVFLQVRRDPQAERQPIRVACAADKPTPAGYGACPAACAPACAREQRLLRGRQCGRR